MKLICSFFLIFLLISIPIKGQDTETLPTKYPTKIIYESMLGCYQGTYKWIVMTNPALRGRKPPVKAQQKMTEHCFCVLDMIRIQKTYSEYISKVYDFKYMNTLWMTNAVVCVKNYGTLSGIMKFEDNSSDNKSTQLDNSTIVPKKQDDLEEKNEGEQETTYQG